MSKSVSVIITDDLNGSEHAETVSSGFDGVTYEIDLGKKNRSRLRRALAPFIEPGRRAPWRQPPRSLTCGPQRRAGLGRGGWPEGLRARPDQRRHHAAVRRGLLGRNLRDLGCPGEGSGLRGRRVRGWLGGCCWFLEEEWDGRAGQFEDAALDGCVDGEFLGFAAR